MTTPKQTQTLTLKACQPALRTSPIGFVVRMTQKASGNVALSLIRLKIFKSFFLRQYSGHLKFKILLNCYSFLCN